MDIEIKRMSSDTIERFDQLNIVCKRFHVNYPRASEKDRLTFFREKITGNYNREFSPPIFNIRGENHREYPFANRW